MLTDRYGRVHTYLRISVTDRCNLRCVYCMPAEGITPRPKEDILTFREIGRIARAFVRLGIDKIRLTGGEPLVRRDLPHLVEQLAAIEGVSTIGLTTNGVLLGPCAAPLRRAGLGGVNVSLDTLRPARFGRIALRAHFHDVLAGIDAALDAGFAPVKINVVVMGGVNDDELPDFVEMTRDRLLNVRFIEFMPFRSNGWEAQAFVPFAAMRAAVERRYTLIPAGGDPDAGTVAREFRIDGHVGTVGFIASMSEHFCDGCNRLRLTADGSVKSCLFTPAEVSLRAALRGGVDDAGLEALVRSALHMKPRIHPGIGELDPDENRSMVEIGG